ncbi:MAG: helix-turn-helix transcriptional regulator [Bacteroidaceae bacterium]|nr:helix-turn-helix transcriptional regulator [Bacteroidaceae bacterium]
MAKLNRIKVALAERDLSNKWLAEKIGKDPATVSKWITNTTQPNIETLMQIAKVLETQVDDLLRFEELPEIPAVEEIA